MANTSPTPDSLTVYLSGDAWNGNAEATVSINGVQVGGVLDVSAANASDGAQAFTFTGNFGAAPKVSLSFVNDASDGTPGHDRNLYLDGYSYDGNAQLGTKQALLWDQTVNTTLSSAPAATERASAFLNSMGVNVHLNYLDTSYGNTAAAASDVAYLGVSRLRIGLADITLHLPQLQAFAAEGVKFDVLMPGTETDASLAADVAKLNAIAPSVAAVEGPNEPNLPGNFSWDGQSGNAAVAAYQKALFTDVKATPSLASAAIYAPTLGGVGADGYAALGNISAYATAGNMHIYYPGTAPNSTIQYNLGLSAIDTPGLPSVITETNYTNDPAIQGSVSSDVQAKYDLDIFMDAAKAGVQSTYIYELMDEFADPTNANIEDHYGLFNVDGTPKPAATAIHNLHAILADPGATASTFTPGTLAYTVTGQGASSNTLLMEKSSGAYDLTVWAEPQIWNAATKSEAAATPRQVTVALGQLASSVSVYDPMAGTAAIAQYSNTSQVTVSVTDHPLVIEINTAPPTLIGGAGLMTVLGGSKEAVTGGSGGLIYTATDGGGGNTITTAAGATDTLALAGPDTVASYGNDTITGGSGNQAMAIHGNATVTGSTGNSTLSFYGHDTLVGRGQDYVTVNAGAEVMITAGVLTTVTMTDAWTVLSAGSGAGASKVSVAGGSAVLSAGTGIGTAVTTAAGRATTMTSYRGAVTEALNGADTLYAGSGTDTTVINAANTVVWGGSGTLLVRNQDQAAKDLATVHGGSGAMTYSQGGGALRFIGGSGAATLDGGWGSLSVTGGAGTLSVAGGSGGLQFTAGSGQASVAMTPGGGDVTFGAGATSVQVASYGAAAVFHAVAGQGGGTDTITGFRIGTDRLLLSGVSVASEAASGGSTSLVLSDRTHIQLVGVGDPTHLFG